MLQTQFESITAYWKY